jgi:hypothetical protein
MKRIWIIISCALVFFTGALSLRASVTNGVIDTTFRSSIFSGGFGRLNAGKYTDTALSSYNVEINDNSLTGYMWGEQVGWINLNCSNTNTCGTNNFKVANTKYGIISGYAWGENTGWINFGPFLNNSATTVTINNSGEFNGYAWTQNYGWIKFSCDTGDVDYPNSCVKTDWRPVPARPLCNNTLDDDGDGMIDYPSDAGCVSLEDNDEIGPFPPPPLDWMKPQNPVNPSDSCKGILCFIKEKEEEKKDKPKKEEDIFEIKKPTLPPPRPFSYGRRLDPYGRPFSSLNDLDPITFITQGLPNVFDRTFNNIKISYETLLEFAFDTARGASVALSDKEIRSNIGAISVLGLIVSTVVLSMTSFFYTPLAFPELFLIPGRFVSLILSMLGIRKKKESWGKVQTENNIPIDPVFMVLIDSHGREVAGTMTNHRGEYSFSVAPGTYRVLARKYGYEPLHQEMSITVPENGLPTTNIVMKQIIPNVHVKIDKDDKYTVQELVSLVSEAFFVLGAGLVVLLVITNPEKDYIFVASVYALVLIVKSFVVRALKFAK